MPDGGLVLDASAMVDLLIEAPSADAIIARLKGSAVHVPGHFDAEVLSAIARLTRAGELSDARATEHVAQLATAPYLRHATTPLVAPAWLRRGNMRVADALYVELSARLGLPLVTTDAGLAASAPDAELIRPS
jgi:predicted nucleic acid-binding protein